MNWLENYFDETIVLPVKQRKPGMSLEMSDQEVHADPEEGLGQGVSLEVDKGLASDSESGLRHVVSLMIEKRRILKKLLSERHSSGGLGSLDQNEKTKEEDIAASRRDCLVDTFNDDFVEWCIERHEDGTQSTFTITLQDLSFEAVDHDEDGKEFTKQILHPITTVVERGKLVALMGPSGCGKSTLLDILAGKKTAIYSGNVFVNGNLREMHAYRRLTSYVPQADYFNGLETVRESILFSSIMKCNYGKKGDSRRLRHVSSVLELLGLSAIADTRIGNSLERGISGGQKRRVSLGKGLVAGTSVLFADEPTSGLSSSDSQTVVECMSNVAKLGNTTIICVIHQPRYVACIYLPSRI